MKDPLSIVLEAAQEHVNEIEYRSHTDETIARGDRIRAAIQALEDPARIDASLAQAQRDWLLRLHEIVDEQLETKAADAGDKLCAVVNLLDGLLDSLEGYSRRVGPVTFVYVVPRNTPDGLSLCAFEDEHRAHEYADRYPGAAVYPEELMNDSAAGQFLIDMAAEDRPPAPDAEARLGSEHDPGDRSEPA